MKPAHVAEQEMIAAWEAAGRELGIRVRAPVSIDGSGFPVLVEQFGSPKGARDWNGDILVFWISKQAGQA